MSEQCPRCKSLSEELEAARRSVENLQADLSLRSSELRKANKWIAELEKQLRDTEAELFTWQP